MEREEQGAVGGKCARNRRGEIKVREMEIMERWREYSRDLLCKQNQSQQEETANVKGPLKITEKWRLV